MKYMAIIQHAAMCSLMGQISTYSLATLTCTYTIPWGVVYRYMYRNALRMY